MNIMLFSRICAKTGVGNHMKQLANELVRQGHSVWVLSSTNEQEIVESEKLKFITMPFATKNPLTCFKNLKALHRVVKDNNIEVVHCHHRVAALYMKFYRVFWKTPVVYTLHLAPIPHDFLHRIFTYVGDMAIGVSTEVSEFLHNRLKVPKSKIRTVLNGVPTSWNCTEVGGLREKFSIPHNKYALLLNSRIDSVKNHMIMVKAVNELPEEIKEKIIVICTGKQEGSYYKTLVEKIESCKLQKQFLFVGWVDPYAISAVSDFLFLPSHKEGFSLSIAEAFFMKLPAARTATGGWEDLKVGCLQIFPDRTDEIKNIIIKLVSEGKKAFAEQIERAYSFANKNLTVEIMTRNTVEIYKQAIEVCYGKHKCAESTK